MAFFVSFFAVSAQDEVVFDEVPITINMKNYGSYETAGFLAGEKIYLPIVELFDFLKIRNVASRYMDSVSGFFINPEASYIIDHKNLRVQYKGDNFNVAKSDLILSETGLYMNNLLFGKIFGLDCNFSFRNMTVELESKNELPVMRDLRLEKMRANVNKIKGDVKVDTTLKRDKEILNGAILDWAIISSQQQGGLTNTRINNTFGGVLFGGETKAIINYNVGERFLHRDQNYTWRYVDNSFKPIRQITLGRITTQTNASVYSPMLGAQITNAATTYRRSFGSFSIKEYTTPGWTVELYVNNVLVNFVIADANGFYTFDVPLMYGGTTVKLRFFGLYGEEQTVEKSINVPFNFLPVGEFEYKLSAAAVEDSTWGQFSRFESVYGLADRITVGGGIEYLSTIIGNKYLPFANASFRIGSNTLLKTEYTHGVFTKTIFNSKLPAKMQIDLTYINYDKNQTALPYVKYLEDLKVSLVKPFKFKSFALYSRIAANQFILPQTKYTTGEFLLSSTVKGISINHTTYYVKPGSASTYLYSSSSMGFKLFKSVVITPQIQYAYTPLSVVSMRVDAEKQLGKNAFLSASIDKNISSETPSMQIGFRYGLKAAQIATTVRYDNNRFMFVESARGSILAAPKTKYWNFNDRNGVGRGGLTILAFIDKNCNNIRDVDEKKIYGLSFKTSGGRIEYVDRDSSIRLLDMEPYVKHLLEFDKTSFDNIAYQYPINSMNIEITPNQLRLIQIPIYVMGEASGVVYKSDGQTGQGRVYVCIYDNKSNLVTKVLTEGDGYFTYLGLKPGKYTAMVDSSQLRKINMSASEPIPFTINPSDDGDLVDNLEFTLSVGAPMPKEAVVIEVAPIDSIPEIVAPQVVIADTIKKVVDPIVPVKEIVKPVEAVVDTIEKAVVIEVAPIDSIPEIVAPQVVIADTIKKVVDPIVPVKEIVKPVEAVVDTIKKAVVIEVAPVDSIPEIVAPQVVIADTIKKVVDPIVPVKEIVKPVEAVVDTIKKAVVIEVAPVDSIPEIVTPKVVIADTIKKVVDPQIQLADSIEIGEQKTTTQGTIKVQMGSYKRKEYAITVQKKLEETLGRPVEVVFEDGNYKVFVSGVKDAADLKTIVPELIRKGYKPSTPKELEVASTNKTSEFVDKPGASYSVQLGAYLKEANAQQAQKRLSESLNRPVEIFNEDGFYKVRLVNISGPSETEKLLPLLMGRGLKDVFVATKGDIVTAGLVIQAGSYKTESEANDAKNKIEKSLTRPVSIVQENGLFNARLLTISDTSEIRKVEISLRNIGFNNTKTISRISSSTQVVTLEQEKKPIAEQPIDTAKKSIESKPIVPIVPVIPRDTVVAKAELVKSDSSKISDNNKIVRPVEIPVQIETIQQPTDSAQIKIDNTDELIAKQAVADTSSLQQLADKVASTKGNYTIHVGLYNNPNNALSIQQTILQDFGVPVTISVDGKNYRIKITGFDRIEEANIILQQVIRNGYLEAYVAPAAADDMVFISEIKPDRIKAEKKTTLTVVIESYNDKLKAMAVVAHLQSIFKRKFNLVEANSEFRVQLSGFSDEASAKNFIQQLDGLGYRKAKIVK